MANAVRNINAAQLLLENYGKDSLSYFALHDKKLFFFSSTGQSFLSYTVIEKIALVSGDPIGPINDIPLLLKEFNFFVKGANRISCFLAINHETLQNLLTLGHEHLHIGKEAVIKLTYFKKNLLKKKVRRAERSILNQGIICRVYKRSEIPNYYLDELQMVSENWLKEKGGKEKRYTMTLGRIPTELDPDCEIALALLHNKVIGYLTFVPIYAAKGLSLDAARKTKYAPNGLIEFLLIQSFEHFKNHGIVTISLNFVTFHYSTDDFDKSANKIIFSIFYKFLSYVYKTNNLYNFNNKFLPIWQERYMAFEKKRYLPSYVFAITKTEL